MSTTYAGWNFPSLLNSWEAQLSFHSPSAFILEHWQRLLPQWDNPVASVLIYLQFSPVQLCDRTAQTEAVKNRLRDEFLVQAQRWHQHVTGQGYLAEPFDPKLGTPLYSKAGDWHLDDVALAHALLQLPTIKQGGCQLLCHPQWETGVFPATLLSSAEPKQLQRMIVVDPLTEA